MKNDCYLIKTSQNDKIGMNKGLKGLRRTQWDATPLKNLGFQTKKSVCFLKEKSLSGHPNPPQIGISTGQESPKIAFRYQEPHLSKKEVFKAFKKFGPLIRCFIKNKDTKNPEKRGYVKYRKPLDAEKVIKFNFIKQNGFKIIIDPFKALPSEIEPSSSYHSRKLCSVFNKRPKIPPKDIPQYLKPNYQLPSPSQSMTILKNSWKILESLQHWIVQQEQDLSGLNNERMIQIVDIKHVCDGDCLRFNIGLKKVTQNQK